MKKPLLFLCLTALLVLTACSGPQSGSPQETALKETTGLAENEIEAETEVESEMETEPETQAGPIIPDTYYVSPRNTGTLQVLDGKLCGADGTPIQLKGVSTHAVTRVEPFLNQDLFYEMRTQWGVNVIRLAMYTYGQDGYTKSDYFREKNIELIEKGIDLATDNDMYAIVDWHVLDEGSPLLFQDQALEFFDMISAEYKGSDNIIYEICNEPNGVEWAEIKAYAEAVIPVIRANDPDAIIICGTPDWSQGIDQALEAPLDFDNIMYTLHFYSATHKEELRERLCKCSEAGLPIFVTEYGVTSSNGGFPRDLEEADLWMAAMDEYNISSCIWNLSKNGEACSLIASAAAGYSAYEGEDFNETGQWFISIMTEYKEGLTQ